MTKKKKKTHTQNWLIYRLRGMHSVLTSSNIQKLEVMLPPKYHHYIHTAAQAVRNLVVVITTKRLKK